MKRLLFLSLLLLMATPLAAEMISVIHQPAELRAQPLVARSPILANLSRYTPLEVLGREADYYKVKNYRGQVGFIHRALLGREDSLVVKAAVCNIRSGPGTDNPIAYKAQQGDVFRVLSKQGEWIEIFNEKGNIGWIWQNLTWGY